MLDAESHSMVGGQLDALTSRVEGRCLHLELKDGASFTQTQQLREVACQYHVLNRLRGV